MCSCMSARTPSSVLTVASCPAFSRTMTVDTISASDRCLPSTRACTSDTRSSRGERRRSAMSSSVKSRNASAAVFAASACSSVVSNSYIFTIACDQSRRSRCRSTGTPSHSQMSAIEKGCAKTAREIEAPALDERVEQSACELRSRLPHRLDAPGRERCGHELANARVVGRLEPEQAPALHLPESRPARIERLILELGVGSDMPVVPSETPVTKACANVAWRVTNHRLADSLVVEHGRRLAEIGERRIRLARNAGARGSNSTSLARADVLEQAVDTERDESRRGHAEPDDPERREPRWLCGSPAPHPRGSATSHPRASREQQRATPRRRSDRNREPGVQEVVAVAEAREVDGERQGRDGRDAREDRSPRGSLPGRLTLLDVRATDGGRRDGPSDNARDRDQREDVGQRLERRRGDRDEVGVAEPEARALEKPNRQAAATRRTAASCRR